MSGIQDFAEPRKPNENDATIKRLASLHTLEYEKVRDSEAKALHCRPGVLDDLVKKERSRQNPEAKNGGTPALCPQTDLWPSSVVPAALLDEIQATIQAFIVCDEEVAIAGTLWAAFTWFIDVVQVAPLAVITAPEPRCGKTQFLDLLGRLACRPLVASNISPAAVFRVIEAQRPTLMIDEVDSFLKENEELRGVINSGHTRQSAYVIRIVGDDYEPKRFSTWGAKALSGIGRLAGTLMDRAVVLELRRKLKSEKVQRLRHADPAQFERLASQLATFAEAASPDIQRARPQLPDELNDRAQDNWEPLLAVADHAGGTWPKKARLAALKLAGVEQEPLSQAVQLLADIQEVFTRKNVGRLGTSDLLRELASDDLKPWLTYDHGRPVTAAQLAKLLKPYGIKPKDLKLAGGTLKGYSLEQFGDVFERYLDPSQEGVDSPQPATSEAWREVPGSPSEIGSATTRDPQPIPGSEVAPDSMHRDQGATSRIPLLLDSCEVAGDEGGEQTDTDSWPKASGDGWDL